MEPDTVKHSDLRTIFYDEGFIKLLGANGFILSTLAVDGTPINIAIEPKRDAQTIYGYFVQAMTQLGGIDVIIGDGARTIFAAAKALRQPLILIQHIHKGKGKRTRIIKLEPIANRKALKEITVELHTGSMSEEKTVMHYFGWISTTGTPKETMKKKQDIINITKEIPLRFLYGHPTKPFNFSVFIGGEEIYSPNYVQ